MTIGIQGMQNVTLVDPVSGTASASARLDCYDCDYATITVRLSAETNTSNTGPTISLLSSDDTIVTNFATITADRTGEGSATAHKVVYHVDMKNRKRYLRLTLTPDTTTNGPIVLEADAIKSRLKEGPANTTDMVESGDAVVIV